MNTEVVIKEIAWPVAVVIIALSFMLIFRKQIIAFLQRVKTVSHKGIETALGQEQLIVESKKPSYFEEFMKITSPILRQQEEAIEKDIKEKGLTENETKSVLVRHLAIYQLAFLFEQINSIIWGSQIKLLEDLNSKPLGETRENLKRFYELGATLYPATYENYSFVKYLNYLVLSGLINEKEGKYFITDFGREFLIYLASTGKTGFRAL